MITKIKGKGFLGPAIDQTCSNKMIFVGSNRSNKTTRTNIIHLCLNGFVATGHKIYKKPADILNQYCSGDKLTCAIEIGKTEFEISFNRDSKGKCSKKFRVNKKKYSEKEYMEELFNAGNPKIIDLESFIQMSDAKKIEQLFKLYPASVDVQSLNSDISKAEDKISNLKASIDKKKSVIQENTKSKKEIELPAGTLSEIIDELEDHKIAYRGTRDKIAVLKAKQEVPKEQPNVTYSEDAHLPSGTFPGIGENKSISQNIVKVNGAIVERQSHVDFLKTILKSMQKTNCSMCVASILIKKEIRES